MKSETMYLGGSPESPAKTASVNALLEAIQQCYNLAMEIRKRVDGISDKLFGNHRPSTQEDEDKPESSDVFSKALDLLGQLNEEQHEICRLLVGLEQECAIGRDG